MCALFKRNNICACCCCEQHISLCISRSSKKNCPNIMMNAGTRGTQIPSILSSERGIVGRGKKDREGPPPGSGGWGGVTGAHVTFQGGCDDSSWTLTCTTSTSALHVHESGDTVGDYIQRGPLRGGWSPGTLMWWWQVCASELGAGTRGGLNCRNPPSWSNNFQTDLVFQNIVIYRI